MRRVIRSFRTRKNIRRQNAIRDQFLRELIRDSDALMKQLSEQFSQQLNAQLTQLTQQALGSSIVSGDVASPTLGNSGPGSIYSFAQLLSTGARYLISRPRTRRNTQESIRSTDAESSFRVSQAQAAAELQALLSKGEKNR